MNFDLAPDHLPPDHSLLLDLISINAGTGPCRYLQRDLTPTSAGAASSGCLIRQHDVCPTSPSPVPTSLSILTHPLHGQGQHGRSSPCHANSGRALVRGNEMFCSAFYKDHMMICRAIPSSIRWRLSYLTRLNTTIVVLLCSIIWSLCCWARFIEVNFDATAAPVMQLW